MGAEKKQGNKFMLDVATAYNLKKWLDYPPINSQTKINTIQKSATASFLLLLLVSSFRIDTFGD